MKTSNTVNSAKNRIGQTINIGDIICYVPTSRHSKVLWGKVVKIKETANRYGGVSYGFTVLKLVRKYVYNLGRYEWNFVKVYLGSSDPIGPDITELAVTEAWSSYKEVIQYERFPTTIDPNDSGRWPELFDAFVD